MEKKTLTDKFNQMVLEAKDNPTALAEIYRMVADASESGEKDGLLSLAYHEGIGVEEDLEKSFAYAEKAAFEGGDPLGYLMLGYMCDHFETPDQSEGGPRQKYDHYDAERFYEICAGKDSPWKKQACNWLGDYYLDSTKGGDPEIGVEYYEKVAYEDEEAAGKLSDYYWDIVMPDNTDDKYWTDPLFKWTKVAAELDPEEYDYRLGWLYADGIGCGKSPWSAMKYFNAAYFHGDWRGALSIADMLEYYMNDHADTEEEKKAVGDIVALWRDKANEMKEQSDAEEYDPSEEED